MHRGVGGGVLRGAIQGEEERTKQQGGAQGDDVEL
jgi:hypothetical protein